jgi:serine/threonine-protein kinase
MSSLEDLGYRVLGPISRGGMAEILLAERVGAGGVRKRLVLKRLLPDLANDRDFLRMFHNEARIAVDLQNANIVSVFEFGEAEGRLFLAMEYIRGWNVAKVLEACDKARIMMPLDVALHVAREVAEALAYAHEKTDEAGASLGIVHRDVSPANVLVSTDGEVKLADFGIARAAALARSTQGQWLRGKIPYMSPEQANAQPLDGRSDVYSLGIVLFEMITTTRRFEADGDDGLLHHVRNPRPFDLRALRQGVPRDVEALVSKALAPEPGARFATARAMADAIAAALLRMGRQPSAQDVRAFLATLALPAPQSPGSSSEEEGEEEETARIVEPPPAPPPTAVTPAASQARPASRPDSPPTIGRHPFRMAVGASMAFACALLAARWAGRMTEPEARLEIRTPIAGATVWIDGIERGRTPLVLHDLGKRRVEVRVTLDDAGTELRRTVDLASARDQVIDVSLK